MQPADKARGLENFARNLEFVNEKNAEREKGGHLVGLNKFADLSNDEFKVKYTRRMNMKRRTERKVEMYRERKYESCEAPWSLDWRKKGAVTGVKDQGDCGTIIVIITSSFCCIYIKNIFYFSHYTSRYQLCLILLLYMRMFRCNQQQYYRRR